MDLKILKENHGLKALDDYLSYRSYISGFQPTKNDLIVLQTILEDKLRINLQSLPHVSRWTLHIQSFSSSDKNSFPRSSDPINVQPQDHTKVVL